jgi:hypothetical protein
LGISSLLKTGMPEKKDPHILIPAGFTVPRLTKVCGEKCPDLMAFGRL